MGWEGDEGVVGVAGLGRAGLSSAGMDWPGRGAGLCWTELGGAALRCAELCMEYLGPVNFVSPGLLD